MTVEKFLGFADEKQVLITEGTEKYLVEYQLELEKRKTIKEDQKVVADSSVLSECKKIINMVPVKSIWIEPNYGPSYENTYLGSEEGKKEVFAFALNGWVAKYHLEHQLLILIKV